MAERELVQAKVRRAMNLLSDHACRRCGLPESTSRLVAARTLWEMACLIRESHWLAIPLRLLVLVLRRQSLKAMENAATGRPELRRLCRLAVQGPSRRTRGASRRCACRLARREQLPVVPSREAEEVLRVQLERLPHTRRDEDWRNAVLAALGTLENPSLSPWVHPGAEVWSEGCLVDALRSPDVEARRTALATLCAMDEFAENLLAEVQRMARDDPDPGVRIAAREALWRRGLPGLG